jgi:phenylacetate-CoA ligase
MAEMVTAASECQAGRLHLWPEAGIVETLENGQAVDPGSAGELICTGLINADMPLIRYRNGDRGALSETQRVEGCACGRTLPVLASVEGRTDDILFARDGRRIGRLDPIFKEGLPVREAQVVQESIRRIRVRYVPADGYSTATGDSLVRRLRDRMGPVEVTLEEVESIPRTSGGKFRAVVCQIPVEERQRLASTGY